MKNLLATFLLFTAVPSFAQDSLEQVLPDSNVASVQESAEVSENPVSVPLQSDVKSPDVKQNGNLLSVNIFQISNRITNKFENGFKNSRKEIGSLSARLETVKESLGHDEYRERMISLLVILAFSIGIAILSGFLVWRAGAYFKSSVRKTASKRRALCRCRSYLFQLDFTLGLSGICRTMFSGYSLGPCSIEISPVCCCCNGNIRNYRCADTGPLGTSSPAIQVCSLE